MLADCSPSPCLQVIVGSEEGLNYGEVDHDQRREVSALWLPGLLAFEGQARRDQAAQAGVVEAWSEGRARTQEGAITGSSEGDFGPRQCGEADARMKRRR